MFVVCSYHGYMCQKAQFTRVNGADGSHSAAVSSLWSDAGDSRWIRLLLLWFLHTPQQNRLIKKKLDSLLKCS